MNQGERRSSQKRKTKETDIVLELNIDGAGQCEIATGIGFFDHMLSALAVHGSLDIALTAKGDLGVDAHHTVEDCGIVIGMAMREALGDKSGIVRYGSVLLPMDEALAQAALDIGGRPFLHYDARFADQRLGGYDVCLTKEFFRALTSAAGITLHLRLLEGENDHHSTEVLYKAFAHAFRQAAAPTERRAPLSTKGVL